MDTKKIILNNDLNIEECKPFAVVECMTKETYEHIKELIERDTPLKIVDIELSDFCEYEINYNCPKCDATLAHKKEEIPIFCPCCGQAIK